MAPESKMMAKETVQKDLPDSKKEDKTSLPKKKEEKSFGWGKKLMNALFIASAIGGALKVAKKVTSKIATKVVEKVISGGLKGILKVGSKIGAKKAAQKAVVKAGTEAASKLTPKLVAKIGEETVKKTGSKLLTWTAAKSLAKKIPFVSLAIGSAFAVGRAFKGDYLGAAMELGSGALACVPGVGTGASLAADVAILGRDIVTGR